MTQALRTPLQIKRRLAGRIASDRRPAIRNRILSHGVVGIALRRALDCAKSRRILSCKRHDILSDSLVSGRHHLGSGCFLMAYPRGALRSASLGTLAARPIKRAIAAQVVALFNDRSRGERPVVRRPDGLFGPQAVAWRVHGDVTSMMVGGVAGLLLQMLHPAVLAGVWDHSNFRNDMHGRLRRTARFIALTTYGGKTEAEAAIARVRSIHARVRGTLPNGMTYFANDPALLAWVHVTEATSFLDAWIRYGEPEMSVPHQDRYFVEMGRVALALGADPIPRTRSEARDLITALRSQMLCDARTQEVARLVLTQQAPNRIAEPLQALAMQAAVDLLPVWARRMHGLSALTFSRPLVRAGTLGIARTLRWAFE
jgi:uncharacterized protein (DUF2236 family)